jgi:xanthine dehydrogenase accessory factor
MEIYVEPLAASASAIERAVALWQARTPALLITPLDGSPKRVDDATAPLPVAPRLVDASFVEPIRPRDRAVLFGAGHVARAIVPLAARVGFEVVVCDDGETGELEAPPHSARVIESFEPSDVEREIGPLGAGDYLVIVTRDHAIDQAILERVLANDELTYLGVIGSLGKVGRFRKRLEAKGLATPERWGRVSAPIGVDIAAETPDEIAVSVVAELIRVRNRDRVRGS